MNTQMKNAQQGFTLIELMIVVAIIGILAAIAIPAYQDYTVRAQVSEALVAVSPAKAGVAEYWATNGETWPTDNSEAGLDTATDYATDVINQLAVGADGVITVSINSLSSDMGGTQTLVYTPSAGAAGQVQWDCDSAGGDDGATLLDKYAPAECRGAS